MTLTILDTIPTLPPSHEGFVGSKAVGDAGTHASQLKVYLFLYFTVSTSVSVLRQPKGILPPSKENPCKYHNESSPHLQKSSGFLLLL